MVTRDRLGSGPSGVLQHPRAPLAVGGYLIYPVRVPAVALAFPLQNADAFWALQFQVQRFLS
jgi:hypothetical protein